MVTYLGFQTMMQELTFREYLPNGYSKDTKTMRVALVVVRLPALNLLNIGKLSIG